MTENEKYTSLLAELGEVIKSKNDKIYFQNLEIANLKQKIQELEAKTEGDINER